MKKIDLSNRLKKASEFVVPHHPILDIGSDHAYLPIYLVQNKLVPKAIAGEVVQGPYENAKSKVSEYGLDKRISVRLGSGLDVINSSNNLGTIFICGMGGRLISSILKEGLSNNKFSNNVRLVLQPNNAEESLRRFLVEANYEIVQETILNENDKIYEIIVAEYTEDKVEYLENEYLFGPFLMKNKSEIFVKKWEREKMKLENILLDLKGSKDTDRIQKFKKKIKSIEQVII